jgi:uncharacterized protein (DUF488 family)
MSNSGPISAPVVFTIGHSNLEIGAFLSLLRRHGVEVVADVRSSPYSQYNPQFNRETLKRALEIGGIRYEFMGDELGARRTERECYVNGRVDYDRVAETASFKAGIQKVLDAAPVSRVALMCAEKDPIQCHRTVLIARRLAQLGARVRHILSDGSLEDQSSAEQRLLQAGGLPESDLFRSRDDLVAEAYSLQARRIAYSEQTTGTEAAT